MAHTHQHWTQDDWSEWDQDHTPPELPPTGAGITEPPWYDMATAQERHQAEAAERDIIRHYVATDAATGPLEPDDAGPTARDAAEAAAGGEVWSHKRCSTCGYYPPCQCPGNPFGT